MCERDSIVDCDVFRRWVKRKGIKPPRYGAVGQHGSIAVVERLIRTIKDEFTRRIAVSMRRRKFRRELFTYVDWHNEHRPDTTLDGRTPNSPACSRAARFIQASSSARYVQSASIE